MDWLGAHLWVMWLVAAIALGAFETASLDLVLLMLAGGALAAMVAAIVTGSLFAQVIVFALASLGLLTFARPGVVRALHGGPDLRLGVTRLIGLESITTQRVSTLDQGRIKIDGEDWAAKPYDPTTVIEPGTPVVVVEIKGATAYIHPLPGRSAELSQEVTP
jgi:membrane protein implicated in regulation of membrane protease activity